MLEIKRYRSKPVEVEAVQYIIGEEETIYKFGGEAVTFYGPEGTEGIKVHTLNGSVELLPDHWLVKGPNDFYPCDPDTFAARWEEVK